MMISAIPITPSHVSINRVAIVDVPGLPIDDAVRGRRAYDLLSSRAVVAYARARAAALRLSPAYGQDTRRTPLELPCYVDGCLDSPDVQTRAAAQAIGRRLGRNLGHILLALRRGDAVNRAARADWTPQDWERWGTIEQVWLGGGLVCRGLGKLILEHACAFLAEVGYAGRPRVALARHPDMMALLGAGRYLPPGTRHALCLDFGHTLVKRAGLGFKEGTLVRLHRYAPLPTDVEWPGPAPAQNPSVGRQVLDFMSKTIAQTLEASRADGFAPAADLVLSVAAYVQGGRLLGNGLYANVSTLADDARPLLAGAIKARTGWKVRVHLIHDGTAASAVHAGEPNTAVLLAGTALGIGFPPADARGLRPLANRLDLG